MRRPSLSLTALLRGWRYARLGLPLVLQLLVWPAAAAGQQPQHISGDLRFPAVRTDTLNGTLATTGCPPRSWLFGVDSGSNDASSTLFRIDPQTASLCPVGETGSFITDIAFLPDGRLFAITFTELLEVDLNNGSTTEIATFDSFCGLNALASDFSGILYAASVCGELVRIDPNTGTATLVGLFGEDLVSSGDLAFDLDGTLYGTATASGPSGDLLVRVDVASGLATVIGAIGFSNVFGLAVAPNGDLYGAANPDPTGTPTLLLINKSSGVGTAVGQLTGASGMFGFASHPSVGLLPGFPADFDGDGKTDIAVYRPSTGTWYIINSASFTWTAREWGVAGDIPVPGDYDGDGKDDITAYRPSTGMWFIIQSSNGAVREQQWGVPGDIPVPGDYDGDGKTDVAAYRPSTGTWFIINSSTGGVRAQQWGLPGDRPVPGDYDGDGKTDIAAYRPSTGVWFIINSSTGGVTAQQWGVAGDIPVPGDYDGDGKTDIAAYRPSTGVWFIIQSSTGAVRAQQWGVAGDIPVPGNYDGDGKTDIAAYRPSTGEWFIIQSSTGAVRQQQWGIGGDQPLAEWF